MLTSGEMRTVAIYSPDRHILFDPEIAERDGIGGGLTARLRLAAGLARQGCKVTLVANLRRRETRKGIEYIPLDAAGSLSADIIILNTTGSGFDLSPVRRFRMDTALKLVWINNTAKIQGLDSIEWDLLVTPSKYVQQVASKEWRISAGKLRVIPNGVPDNPLMNRLLRPGRDPFRLIYTSHPSKGLNASVQLVQRLRQHDTRFHLHVFGGNRLWGQDEMHFDASPGVVWRGLAGQIRLARQLRKATFSIHLQEFEEPFGIALVEAMSAGCIVVASSVGAFPELVRDGVDGVLVQGRATDPHTVNIAAQRMLDLMNDPAKRLSMQQRATENPLPWDAVARKWMDLWDLTLQKKQPRDIPSEASQMFNDDGRDG